MYIKKTAIMTAMELRQVLINSINKKGIEGDIALVFKNGAKTEACLFDKIEISWIEKG